MTSTSSPALRRPLFPRSAYRFVFESLHHTQEQLERPQPTDVNEEEAHVSGPELLEGLRQLAVEQFGLMAITVFEQWGIRSTDDVGRLVFELIDRGDMRKTDRDSIEDFSDVFRFEDAFNRDYVIDTRHAFS